MGRERVSEVVVGVFADEVRPSRRPHDEIGPRPSIENLVEDGHPARRGKEVAPENARPSGPRLSLPLSSTEPLISGIPARVILPFSSPLYAHAPQSPASGCRRTIVEAHKVLVPRLSGECRLGRR